MNEKCTMHLVHRSVAAVDQALEAVSNRPCDIVLCPEDFPTPQQCLAKDGLAFSVFPESLQRQRKITCGIQRVSVHGAVHFYKAAVTRTLNDQRLVRLVLGA